MKRKPDDRRGAAATIGEPAAEEHPQVVVRDPSQTVRRFRRRRRRRLSPVVAGLFVAVALAAAGGYAFHRYAWKQIEFALPAAAGINEQEPWQLDVTAQTRGIDAARLKYELFDAPQGMRLDAAQRMIHWTPSETQGPGIYPIRIVASDPDGSVKSTAVVQLSVLETNQPPTVAGVDDQELTAGQTLRLSIQAEDRDRPAQPLSYRLEAPRGARARLDSKSGEFEWDTSAAEPGEYRLAVVVRERVRGGLENRTKFTVRIAPNPEAEDVVAATEATESISPVEPTGGPMDDVEEAEPPAATDATLAALRELYADRKLFDLRRYDELRAIFARQFERRFAKPIRQTLGPADSDIRRWLDARPEIKEELWLAIDVELDDLPQVLTMYRELWQQFPQVRESHAELAIATSITWDTPRAVQDSGHLATAAQAELPDEQVGAVENFTYLLESDPVTREIVRHLPWEFLVHVVNHRTPIAERQWALRSYGGGRSMIGKCYHDVPYDYLMLQSNRQQTQIEGQAYTLANLREYGGICAMQADYALRVAKSLGVPAEYVSGQNSFGGAHAWVMWVELKDVTPGSIAFSLESWGRYRLDHYYVGNLRDPQTGLMITDRQLELRLHNVGINPRAKRHAMRVMQAWPLLAKAELFDDNERLDYLCRVVKLSPGNELAWLTLAKLIGEHPGERQFADDVGKVYDHLFATFANFPDFTWEVFDDLASFETKAKRRRGLYRRLVNLYIAAQRPDLAFAAGRKLAQLLADDDETETAIAGLATMIQQFAEQGRYVPDALDQLEALCESVEGAEDQLVAFYADFLPRIPKRRGNMASDYCMAMYRRGIERFKAAGAEKLVATYESELAKLVSGVRVIRIEID